MRRILVIAVLLAGTAVPATAVATPRIAPFDWTLMVVTAGPHGASNVKWIDEIVGHGNGHPGVLGDVTSLYNPTDQNHPYLSCSVVFGTGGSPTFTTHAQSRGPIRHLAPGERLAETMFYAQGQDERARQSAVAGSGSVRVLRARGTGAQGIFVKDGTPAPFGSEPGASYDTITRSGIAGGFVNASLAEDLAVDRATWTAPDGSSGAFTNGGLPVNGCPSPWSSNFAGGSGHWNWSWIGLSQSQGGGAVAGWAPVGRYWQLFRPAPGGPLGITPPPMSISVTKSDLGASTPGDRGMASAWPIS